MNNQYAGGGEQRDKTENESSEIVSYEAALIRLVSAILMEISEEWETGRAYLDMTTENENNDSSQIYRKNVA